MPPRMDGIFIEQGSIATLRIPFYRSGFQRIAQNLDDLLGCGRPGLRTGIHFFQWVDDVLGMQGHVGFAQGGTEAGIKSSIPLLVLVPKAHHDQIRLLNQGSGTDGIDFGGFVITPKNLRWPAPGDRLQHRWHRDR